MEVALIAEHTKKAIFFDPERSPAELASSIVGDFLSLSLVYALTPHPTPPTTPQCSITLCIHQHPRDTPTCVFNITLCMSMVIATFTCTGGKIRALTGKYRDLSQSADLQCRVYKYTSAGEQEQFQ